MRVRGGQDQRSAPVPAHQAGGEAGREVDDRPRVDGGEVLLGFAARDPLHGTGTAGCSSDACRVNTRLH